MISVVNNSSIDAVDNDNASIDLKAEESSVQGEFKKKHIHIFRHMSILWKIYNLCDRKLFLMLKAKRMYLLMLINFVRNFKNCNFLFR